MSGTLWDPEEFNKASEAKKLIRTIREQVIPHEAENRVKNSKGRASIYYVYGRPKSGGVVIARDSDGVQIVTDRILLGKFESYEEAISFQNALNSKIRGQE